MTPTAGLSKSSLLRAGLIPAFEAGNVAVPRSQRWPRLLMTPGPRPIEALCTGIAAMTRLPAGDVVDALVTHPDRFDLPTARFGSGTSRTLPTHFSWVPR